MRTEFLKALIREPIRQALLAFGASLQGRDLSEAKRAVLAARQASKASDEIVEGLIRLIRKGEAK